METIKFEVGREYKINGGDGDYYPHKVAARTAKTVSFDGDTKAYRISVYQGAECAGRHGYISADRLYV